jgi:hypothetical protein
LATEPTLLRWSTGEFIMHGGICRNSAIGLVVAFVVSLGISETAMAQIFRPRARQDGPVSEAFVGEPYGVGRWTITLPPGVNPAALGESGFVLTEKNGRVRFQAFQAEPVRTVAREILGRPQNATVYFLFTGAAPLELQLFTPAASSTSITPQNDPVGQAKLASEWWVRYTQQANRLGKPADVPDIVDNYLLGTLSRRLNLPPASQVPPPPIRQIANTIMGMASGGQPALPGMQSGDAELDNQAGLLLGADSLRSEMQQKALKSPINRCRRASRLLATCPRCSAKLRSSHWPNMCRRNVFTFASATFRTISGSTTHWSAGAAI